MKIMVVIGMACILLVIGGLNRLNAFYEKRAAIRRKEYFDQLKIIDPEVSYSKYEKIAKRASVPNTPDRMEGDFWDLLILHEMAAHTDYVEDRLAYAGCGEDDR